MRRVLVRFLLRNSPHTLEIIMKEDDARAEIAKWREVKRPGFIGGYDAETDRHWALDIGEISSIFTMDYETIRRAQEQQQRAQGQPAKSDNLPYRNRPGGFNTSN